MHSIGENSRATILGEGIRGLHSVVLWQKKCKIFGLRRQVAILRLRHHHDSEAGIYIDLKL